MKSVVVLVAIVAVVSGASLKAKRAVKQQIPVFYKAVDQLRGKSRLSIPEQFDLIATARAGQDYPNLVSIPQTNFDCGSTHQPGFYADTSAEARCQVFHRCDINGNQTSYLCPNMSLFNQLTLTCSWFFDVDCSKTAAFYDYSNVRLYQGSNVRLLDDYFEQNAERAAGGRVKTAAAPAKAAAAPAPEAVEGEAAAE